MKKQFGLNLIILFFVLVFGMNDAYGFGKASNAWLKDSKLKVELKGMLEMTGTVPCQWRVIWTKDPSHKAGVSWSTREAGENHVVFYDTESRKGRLKKYSQQVKAYKNGEYHRGNRDRTKGVEKAFYHHVKLEGLKPSTRYYFVIQSDKEVSREFYFITAPEDDRPFAILSSGDSRSDHKMRCRMNLMMRHFVESRKDLLAMAHGGDYVYSGGRFEHWTKWLSHNELCVGRDGRILPDYSDAW